MADWTVVYSVDDAGHPQRAAVAHCEPGHEPLTRELQELPVGGGSATHLLRVLRTRQPEVVNDVSGDDLTAMAATPRELELLRALGVSSFAIVPMTARGRALGAVALVSSTPSRRFTDDDVTLMADVAGRAALAIDNARLYAEAQQANQSKTDFLAVVSHDLRTPLNAIVGFADLLSEGIPQPLPEQSLDSVQRIRTSARHLMYLLNELLLFARLDGGAERLQRSACDMCAVARDVAEVMERLAQARGLSFRLLVPDAPLPADTDPDKLRQVLLNLVSNAVKYTRRGSVALELSAEGGGDAVFTVRDSGIGIAPEHLTRIFDPFWQVESTARARGEGTGLGLSVVRRLLQLLGGSVRVASEVGQGTTFVVRVPRSAPAPAAAEGVEPA
jgi:signal transduction histidine kinase